MTCTIFYSTEMPNSQAKVTGGIPTKAMRWHVDYVVKTPGGLTVMGHTIGEIGDDVGNEATFVSWRATAHGGKKKSRKGGKRKCS